MMRTSESHAAKRRLRRSFARVACALVLTSTSEALAQSASPAETEEPRPVAGAGAGAKEHFAEALNNYREGHYRAAIAELKAALTIDPTSKDLLYNLALVHEKLGELDDAIAALDRYAEIETDPKELERAKQAKERMRGARAELAPPRLAPRVAIPPPIPPLQERRSDALLVAGLSVAGAAAAVGVIFGIRALTLRPSANESTGPHVSIDDIKDQQARAMTSAKIADVSFAIGLLSGAFASLLWLHDGAAGARASAATAPATFGFGATF